jgi:hypothetical protein
MGKRRRLNSFFLKTSGEQKFQSNLALYFCHPNSYSLNFENKTGSLYISGTFIPSHVKASLHIFIYFVI